MNTIAAPRPPLTGVPTMISLMVWPQAVVTRSKRQPRQIGGDGNLSGVVADRICTGLQNLSTHPKRVVAEYSWDATRPRLLRDLRALARSLLAVVARPLGRPTLPAIVAHWPAPRPLPRIAAVCVFRPWSLATWVNSGSPMADAPPWSAAQLSRAPHGARLFFR